MRNVIKRYTVFITAVLVLSIFTACSSFRTLFYPEVTETTTATTTEVTTAATTETTSETTKATTAATTTESTTAETTSASIDENGEFTTKDDVALYLHTYGHLPHNFITKKEAKNLGWSSGGLDKYLYGGCIGGDRYGNYEGNLPEASGRKYFECDIDTMHQRSRGAKRIVYSNDGLIYYTEDHYSTFVLLYSGA